MQWKIITENLRDFADESYYLKAERYCPEGTLILEIDWAQIMYAVSVHLYGAASDHELLYDCMVFGEDRIEKYGHQIMRITEKSPVSQLQRLYSMQKDSVLNFVLSNKYSIEYRTKLPKKEPI